MSELCDSPLEVAKERLRIPTLWVLLGLAGRPGKSCRSPLRGDRNPSFSIYDDGRKWKDHATGQCGDAADFVALACNLSLEDACRKLIELANIVSQFPRIPRHDRFTHSAEEEKARKRQGWPIFEPPTRKELKAIAEVRGLSKEGVSLAAEAGLLWCADYYESRAWIITDSRRKNAQARRIDGQTWTHIGDKKAWTLPGSEAAWPIGLREAAPFPLIALVEGGPDLLAAFHLVWCAGVESQVAPVAILGAANGIPNEALRYFAERRVRIFPHDDRDGRDAEAGWAAQLLAAGADVASFSFAGLWRADDKPIKDLNDFAHVHPDQLEAERDALEQVFGFPPEHDIANQNLSEAG